MLLPAKMTARNLCARHKKSRNSITSTPAKSSRVGSKSLEAKSHQRASFQQMLVDKNNTKTGWFCYCALLMEECSQQKSTEKKFCQSRIVVQGTSSSSRILFLFSLECSLWIHDAVCIETCEHNTLFGSCAPVAVLFPEELVQSTTGKASRDCWTNTSTTTNT